jgi:hypothetical protein
MISLSPNPFIVALFEEVINSVQDDANYRGKYPFDKHVFQKFIAVMFVNYATTDPMFYGINKRDYGVSGDKDMEDTPLYKAIARELREIEERTLAARNPFNAAPVIAMPNVTPGEPDFALAAPLPGAHVFHTPEEGDGGHLGGISYEQAGAMLPRELINEDVLLGPLHSLCSAASLLRRKSDPDTQRFARVILADASKLVQELKRLGIVSPVANDPGHCE